MICTVSTVLDSPANVMAFVDRNLAAGADHMFVFLDDGDAEVHAALSRRPHVTAVRAGSGYWKDQRPGGLNQRQVINADVANVALTLLPRVRWIFHLDGDECLDVDRQELMGLGSDVRSVRLETLEAVSRPSWDGPVTHFKRQLDHDDLCLLAILGLVDEPDVHSYFRGHLRKPGMRPSVRTRLRLHHVVNRQDRPVAPYHSPALRVLHYESHSGEEFVRKWMRHLDNGLRSHRGQRDWVRSAIRSVTSNPAVDDARRQELLLEIYRRRAQDDFDTLDGLGFLEQLDPARHRHVPEELPADDRTVLEWVLDRLCAADKEHFARNSSGPRPAQLLRSLRREAPDRDVGDRIDAALTRG